MYQSAVRLRASEALQLVILSLSPVSTDKASVQTFNIMFWWHNFALCNSVEQRKSKTPTDS